MSHDKDERIPDNPENSDFSYMFSDDDSVSYGEEPESVKPKKNFDDSDDPGSLVNSPEEKTDKYYAKKRNINPTSYTSGQSPFNLRQMPGAIRRTGGLNSNISNRPVPVNRLTTAATPQAQSLLNRISSTAKPVPASTIIGMNQGSAGDVKWVNPFDAKIESRVASREDRTTPYLNKVSGGNFLNTQYSTSKESDTSITAPRTLGSLRETLESVNKLRGKKNQIQWQETTDIFNRPVLRHQEKSGRFMDLASGQVKGNSHITYGPADDSNQNIITGGPVFRKNKEGQFEVAGIRTAADNLMSVLSGNNFSPYNYYTNTEGQKGPRPNDVPEEFSGGKHTLSIGKINAQSLNQGRISIPKKVRRSTFDSKNNFTGYSEPETIDSEIVESLQDQINEMYRKTAGDYDSDHTFYAERKRGGNTLKNAGDFISAFAPLRKPRTASVNSSVYDNSSVASRRGELFSAVSYDRTNPDARSNDSIAGAKNYKHIDLTGGGRGQGTAIYDTRTGDFRKKIRSAGTFEGRNFYDEGTELRSVRLMSRMAFTEGGAYAINPDLQNVVFNTQTESGAKLQDAEHRPGDVFFNPKKKQSMVVGGGRYFHKGATGGSIGDSNIPLNNADFGMITAQNEIYNEDGNLYGMQTSVAKFTRMDTYEDKNRNSKDMVQPQSADTPWIQSLAEQMGISTDNIDNIKPFADPGVRMGGQAVNMWLGQVDAEYQDNPEASIGMSSIRLITDYIRETRRKGISDQDALGTIRLGMDGESDRELDGHNRLYDEYRGMRSLYSRSASDGSGYKDTVDNQAKIAGYDDFLGMSFGDFVGFKKSYLERLSRTEKIGNTNLPSKAMGVDAWADAQLAQQAYYGRESKHKDKYNPEEIARYQGIKESYQDIARYEERIRTMSGLVNEDGTFNIENLTNLRDRIDKGDFLGVDFGLFELNGSDKKKHHTADIMMDAANDYIMRKSKDVEIRGVTIGDNMLRQVAYTDQLKHAPEGADAHEYAKSPEAFDAYIKKTFTSSEFTSYDDESLQGNGFWTVSYMDKAFHAVEMSNVVASMSKGYADLSPEQLTNLKRTQPAVYDEIVEMRGKTKNTRGEDAYFLLGEYLVGKEDKKSDFDKESFLGIDKEVRTALDPSNTLGPLHQELGNQLSQENIDNAKIALRGLHSDDLEVKIRQETLRRYAEKHGDSVLRIEGRSGIESVPPLRAVSGFFNKDSQLGNYVYDVLSSDIVSIGSSYTYKVKGEDKPQSQFDEILNPMHSALFNEVKKARDLNSTQKSSVISSVSVLNGAVSTHHGLPDNIVVVNREDYQRTITENFGEKFKKSLVVSDESTRGLSRKDRKELVARSRQAMLDNFIADMMNKFDSGEAAGLMTLFPHSDPDQAFKAVKSVSPEYLIEKYGDAFRGLMVPDGGVVASPATVASFAKDADGDRVNFMPSAVSYDKMKKSDIWSASLADSSGENMSAIKKMLINQEEYFKYFSGGHGVVKGKSVGALAKSGYDSQFSQGKMGIEFNNLRAMNFTVRDMQYGLGDDVYNTLLSATGIQGKGTYQQALDMDASHSKAWQGFSNMMTRTSQITEIEPAFKSDLSLISHIGETTDNEEAKYAVKDFQAGHYAKSKDTASVTSDAASGLLRELSLMLGSKSVESLRSAADAQYTNTSIRDTFKIRHESDMRLDNTHVSSWGSDESLPYFGKENRQELVDEAGFKKFDEHNEYEMELMWNMIHSNMGHFEDKETDRKAFVGSHDSFGDLSTSPNFAKITAQMMSDYGLDKEKFDEQSGRIESFLKSEYDNYDQDKEYSIKEKMDVIRSFANAYSGPDKKVSNILRFNQDYTKNLGDVQGSGAPRSLMGRLVNPYSTPIDMYADKSNSVPSARSRIKLAKEVIDAYSGGDVLTKSRTFTAPRSDASHETIAQLPARYSRAFKKGNPSKQYYKERPSTFASYDVLGIVGEHGQEIVNIEDGDISSVLNNGDTAQALGDLSEVGISQEELTDGVTLVDQKSAIVRDPDGDVSMISDPSIVQSLGEDVQIPKFATGKTDMEPPSEPLYDASSMGFDAVGGAPINASVPKSQKNQPRESVTMGAIVVRNDDRIRSILDKYQDKKTDEPLKLSGYLHDQLNKDNFKAGVGGRGTKGNPEYRSLVESRRNDSYGSELIRQFGRAAFNEDGDEGQYVTSAGVLVDMLNKQHGGAFTREDAEALYTSFASPHTGKQLNTRMQKDMDQMFGPRQVEEELPPELAPSTSKAPTDMSHAPYISKARVQKDYMANEKIVRGLMDIHQANGTQMSASEAKKFTQAFTNMQGVYGSAYMAKQVYREAYGDINYSGVMEKSGNAALEVLAHHDANSQLFDYANTIVNSDTTMSMLAAEQINQSLNKEDSLDVNVLSGKIQSVATTGLSSVPTIDELKSMSPQARKKAVANLRSQSDNVRSIRNASDTLSVTGSSESAGAFFSAYNESGIVDSVDGFDLDKATEVLSFAENTKFDDPVAKRGFNPQKSERFEAATARLQRMMSNPRNQTDGKLDVKKMKPSAFNAFKRASETVERIQTDATNWMSENQGVENESVSSVMSMVEENSDIIKSAYGITESSDFQNRVEASESNTQVAPVGLKQKDSYFNKKAKLDELIDSVQSLGIGGVKPSVLSQVSSLSRELMSTRNQALSYQETTGARNEYNSLVADDNVDSIYSAQSITSTDEFKNAIRQQYAKPQSSSRGEGGSSWTAAHFEGASEVIGKITGQLQAFTTSMEELGSITELTTDNQDYYYKQLKAGASVFKEASAEILDIQGKIQAGTASDKEIAFAKNIGDPNSELGAFMQEYGANQDTYEKGLKAYEMNRALKGAPESAEQKQLRIWEGLGKSGTSGQRLRGSAGFQELVDSEGLDLGMGINIKNKDALGAISGGMRIMDKAQSAMFATAMFQHSVMRPMGEAVDAYQKRQAITDSALMRGGAMSREDLMSSSHGERIVRGIRNEDFTTKIGGEIYNSTSWLTGSRGSSALAIGAGGLAATAAPAMGLGMLGNTMFGPGAGLIGMGLGAAFGVANRAMTVSNSQDSLNERALAHGQSGALGKFAMNGLDIGGGIGWLMASDSNKAQASAFASVADSYEKFMTDNPTVDVSQFDSLAKGNVESMLKSSGQFGAKGAGFEYDDYLNGAIERLGFETAGMNERGFYQPSSNMPPELMRSISQTRVQQLEAMPDFQEKMKSDPATIQAYKDFSDIDKVLGQYSVDPMDQSQLDAYNGSISNLADSVFEGAKYRAFTTVQGNSGIGIEQASENYVLSKQLGLSSNGMDESYLKMDAIQRTTGLSASDMARQRSQASGELFSQSGKKDLLDVISAAFKGGLTESGMFKALEQFSRDTQVMSQTAQEYQQFKTGDASKDVGVGYQSGDYLASDNIFSIMASEGAKIARLGVKNSESSEMFSRVESDYTNARLEFVAGNGVAGNNILSRASGKMGTYQQMLGSSRLSSQTVLGQSDAINDYIYGGLDESSSTYKSDASLRRRDVNNTMSRDAFTRSINYGNGVYDSLDGRKGTGSGGSQVSFSSAAYNQVDTGKFAGTGSYQYNIDDKEKSGLISKLKSVGFSKEAGVLENANISGGSYGLRRQMATLQYDSQIAGLGIQAASARMGFAFMTGGTTQLDAQGFAAKGDVGKAVNRAGFNAGNGMGFWQVQDRMTQIGREKQDWQMMRQGQNLDLGMRDKALQIRQFNEKWDFNWDWMKTSNNQQRREMNIGRSQQLVQRSWQKEDMSFSRNQSQLGFAWQQEDFDRNIRFARGRDRVDMMREKSRSVIQFGMEQSKMDRDDDRFKETSKWEDERFERDKKFFEKTVEHGEEEMKMEKRHFEERMALDDERMKMAFEDFEMEKKWLAETRAMEDQQRLLERQQQVYNFQYQMASIGLAITTAKEMKDLEDQANALELGQDLLNALLPFQDFLDIDLPLILDNLGINVTLFKEAIILAREEVDKLFSGLGGTTNLGDHVGEGGRAHGGYTGPGGKFQSAGVVHKGEYVIPQEGVPVIRGSNEENTAILERIAKTLENILRKKDSSVNAVIYTNQSKMTKNDLLDAAYNRNRK